jgi:SAM-dependent methyltransferase
MPVEVSAESPGTVVGNVTDKYAGANPLVRWLTRRFLDRLDGMVDSVVVDGSRTALLEVGTGEGEVALRLHRRFDRVVALDLPDAGLRTAWRTHPGPAYLHADVRALPFADDSFAVVLAIEVLEHVPDPSAALRELARVSSAELVLSVPREPWFRLSNLLAGRHVRYAGNTPGHLNHWSSRAFTRLVADVGDVQSVSTPFPWTLVHVRLRGSTGAAPAP